ncbi:MAG: hypothetical protein GX409_09395 [candidate division Zixibacteria bacterium]|jgi:hypothetical protein|nr:hypothetical protein [candidate division Zixibacteria bacterium]
MTDDDYSSELGFSFHVFKSGEVQIRRHGKTVTTLRDFAAREFLGDINGVSEDSRQQLMARYTGNYKRGNERTAKNHPRNSP